MFGKILNRIDKGLAFFEDWTLFIAVMAALLSLFVNVVLRYGANYTLAWSEELIREVIIYTTLIGCSSAIRNRSMIKIDAVIQLVPFTRIPLIFFSHLVTLIFCSMMIYYGWILMLMQHKTAQKTIILQVPMSVIYAIIPVMGIMMLIRSIIVIYQDIQEIEVRK